MIKSKNQKIINLYKNKSQVEAYKLIKKLNSRKLQLVTAESVTGGLIMSTLIDIPLYGHVKYGSFCVYNLEAKRKILNIKTKNIYSEECTEELAINALKKTNASLSLSISGNSMPNNKDVLLLSEIFITVAGYDINNNIITHTKKINLCNKSTNKDKDFKESCEKWINKIAYKNENNSFEDTMAINQQIRYYAVYYSLRLCMEFIRKNNIRTFL